MIERDVTIRIGGEAGMGLESSGAGFAKALTRGGLYIFGVPDFYSRIRGGHNFFTLRAASQPLYSITDPVHLLVALDMETVRRHGDEVVAGGAVIYDAKETLPDELKRSDVLFVPVPLTELAKEIGGRDIMRNTLALGVVAGLLDFDVSYVESIVRDNFGKKGQAVVDGNLRLIAAGVEAAQPYRADYPFRLHAVAGAPQRLVLNGTQAFAMGALAGGCRFVSGYPMTPGSGVLVWFAQHGAKYGAVAKHVEDEIAGINMAIGAAVMGARALVPTSGGGYALMVEATGFAAMSETPLVIYNAQRPGPATGLPTRTAQADLLFMLHAAQDEFPRFVLAPGTLEEAFHVGWEAFNLAERYQVPVMVLSDQFLADTFRTIEPDALDFDAVTIDRGALLSREALDALTEPYQRYKVTESGVSPRALPGHPKAIWVTESNEHDEAPRINEEAENRNAQMEKRMRKRDGMVQEVPPPTWYGPEGAEVTFVCWGSTYGPLREAVDCLNAEQSGRANLLHFNGIEPFPPVAEAALRKAKKLVAVEGNFTGQLERIIRVETGIVMDGAIHRYDGRPFRPEYILANLPPAVSGKEA
ncbi:MAG: 2-oxoacid:acceptor oxidoreductase subunit alpha [Anaerolineae bacterium]|jgi:2-oxoglutarate ferredoxin oxidoreductase subunit alpha|nr:2-oxoacid:acceptor oxidoreductase subunit alpha [Anaerolineae bacterium]